MYIKPQNVIPANIKVTRIPTSNKPVKSLYSLEQAHERQLASQAALEEKAKLFQAMLKNGYSVSEALKFVSS